MSSDPIPTGTGVIAALDAVAKPKASAAPRTIVLIIHRSLIFVDSPAHSPIRKTAGAKLPIEHDKNNDTNYRPARFHLDERVHLDERPVATAPVAAAHPNTCLLLQIEAAQENRSALSSMIRKSGYRFSEKILLKQNDRAG